MQSEISNALTLAAPDYTCEGSGLHIRIRFYQQTSLYGKVKYFEC